MHIFKLGIEVSTSGLWHTMNLSFVLTELHNTIQHEVSFENTLHFYDVTKSCFGQLSTETTANLGSAQKTIFNFPTAVFYAEIDYVIKRNLRKVQ